MPCASYLSLELLSLRPTHSHGNRRLKIYHIWYRKLVVRRAFGSEKIEFRPFGCPSKNPLRHECTFVSTLCIKCNKNERNSRMTLASVISLESVFTKSIEEFKNLTHKESKLLEFRNKIYTIGPRMSGSDCMLEVQRNGLLNIYRHSHRKT